MSKSGLTLEECLSLNELPSYDFISSLADKVCKVLLKEDPSYRPVNCVGEPGSLLDLSGGEEPFPAVIIPDIFIAYVMLHYPNNLGIASAPSYRLRR